MVTALADCVPVILSRSNVLELNLFFVLRPLRTLSSVKNRSENVRVQLDLNLVGICRTRLLMGKGSWSRTKLRSQSWKRLTFVTGLVWG